MQQDASHPMGLGIWRLALLAGILAIVLLLTASGLLLAELRDDKESGQAIVETQVLDPPRQIASIELTSQAGDAMSLSELRGAPVLLFFGYTHCPDVCPTTLAEFRQIKEDLGEAGDQVNFVFISVDGSRDSPEIVERYVTQFDSGFIGLTGPEDDVRRLGEDFNLYFAHAEPVEGSSGYLVDHTAYSYLIDPDGRLSIIYPYDTPVARVVEDLRPHVQ